MVFAVLELLSDTLGVLLAEGHQVGLCEWEVLRVLLKLVDVALLTFAHGKHLLIRCWRWATVLATSALGERILLVCILHIEHRLFKPRLVRCRLVLASYEGLQAVALRVEQPGISSFTFRVVLEVYMSLLGARHVISAIIYTHTKLS